MDILFRRTFVIAILLSLGHSYCHGQSTYFNSIFNYNDFSPSVATIAYEGDYVFSGITYDSTTNSLSYYVSRIDSNGSIKYWKNITDPASQYWAGYVGSLVSLEPDGYAAAGNINRPDIANAILYRFNSHGDTLWTREYPDTINGNWTQFWNCNSCSDGGFIMTGYQTVDSYQTNALLVKADSSGNLEWEKQFGNSGWRKQGYSVTETPDMGYLLGIYQYIANDDTTGDPVVLKLDNKGLIEWEKNIGGPTRDFFTQVCIGNDGNYIAGTSVSDSASSLLHYSRIKIVKLSPEGDIIWEELYTGTEIDNKLYSIYPDHSGGYIATGRRNNFNNDPENWSNSFGWLLKISENGDSLWYRDYQYYSGTEQDRNELFDLCLSQDKGYLMVGQASSWTDPQTAWVIKADSLGCDTPGCTTVGIPDELAFFDELSGSLNIYPSPSKISINIHHSPPHTKYLIIIYDVVGNKHDEIEVPRGQRETIINISSYSPGVYVAVLKNNRGMVARRKFIKR